MKYSKTSLDLVNKFEGCELKAYRDLGGVLTIGYGHTLGVYEGQTITLDQAEQYAKEDLSIAESEVNNLVTVPLSQDEFDALVDFVFNLGEGNFARSSLLVLLNKKQYFAAALQFERWDKCGGIIVAGLLRRRVAEHKLFMEDDNGCQKTA